MQDFIHQSCKIITIICLITLDIYAIYTYNIAINDNGGRCKCTKRSPFKILSL